jgi:hypothetical protein
VIELLSGSYRLRPFSAAAPLALIVVLASCNNRTPDHASPSSTQPATTGPTSRQSSSRIDDGEWFTERAMETGLDFVHFNGMSGEFYMSEILGPGVALFDYDNDGDLDIFIVQGQMLGDGKPVRDALFPPKSGRPLNGRLFRNDLQVHADGTRSLKFTDVTEPHLTSATPPERAGQRRQVVRADACPHAGPCADVFWLGRDRSQGRRGRQTAESQAPCRVGRP